MKTEKKFYIDPEQFKQRIRLWKHGTTTDELGQDVLKLIDKLLNHRNFKGYHQDLKDEMRSLAAYWIVRGFKNLKLSMTGRQMFNYCTTAAWTAFVTVIKKHYKNKELMEQLKQIQYEKLKAEFNLDEHKCKNFFINTLIEG